MLPGAELNRMLPLVVAIELETASESELLMIVAMNDHLHVAVHLEPLRNGAPKKI